MRLQRPTCLGMTLLVAAVAGSPSALAQKAKVGQAPSIAGATAHVYKTIDTVKLTLYIYQPKRKDASTRLRFIMDHAEDADELLDV